MVGGGVQGGGEERGEKNETTVNSIIDKIYFKTKKLKN